jgi:hypothetical protein
MTVSGSSIFFSRRMAGLLHGRPGANPSDLKPGLSFLGEGESFGEPVARAKSDKMSDFLSDFLSESFE